MINLEKWNLIQVRGAFSISKNRRKKYMKSLRFIAVAAFLAAPLMTSAQSPNLAGSFLTNIATVTGANFNTSMATQNVTVATQLGGNATSEVDQNAVDGTSITNMIHISNVGNVMADFTVVIASGQTNGIPGSWVTGFVSGATVINVAPGGVADVFFYVNVPGGAPNGSERSYTIFVTNEAPSTANTIETNYVGDNTIPYGGSIGSGGAAPSTVRVSGTAFGGLTVLSNLVGPDYNDTDVWQVTVSAAVVGLTKSVEGVTNNAAGIVGIAIPGATITYKLTLSNTGAASALALQVVDPLPATVSYVLSSLKDAGNVSATWSSAASKTDAADGDSGRGSAAEVIFSPGGSAGAVPADGTLIPDSGYSGFYRVTIN
jgi:uncharacterized repeat protein (TIGR01451 family)